MVARVAAALLLLAVAPVASPPGAGAQNATHPSEYEVKAAYLYNFAKFVEWPAEALPSPGGEFVIGLLGDDPFGAVLERALAGKSVGDWAISVRRYTRPEQARGAQILFVPAAREPELPLIHAALEGTHVLTIADSPGFAERGVIMNFFLTEERKVRFEINRVEADEARLKFSSQILKLATLVGPGA